MIDNKFKYEYNFICKFLLLVCIVPRSKVNVEFVRGNVDGPERRTWHYSQIVFGGHFLKAKIKLSTTCEHKVSFQLSVLNPEIFKELKTQEVLKSSWFYFSI